MEAGQVFGGGFGLTLAGLLKSQDMKKCKTAIVYLVTLKKEALPLRIEGKGTLRQLKQYARELATDMGFSKGEYKIEKRP